MSNKSLKIIIKHLISIVIIVFIMLILNYGFFICVVRYSPIAKVPKNTVKIIAEEFKQHKQLTDKTKKMIFNNNLWVQLIDSKGHVIDYYNQPNDIYNFYSLLDIAKLSKSYLNDYPVYVWKSDNNIVLLGYPKNSITKYNWFFPTNTINNLPVTLVVLMFINLIITIVLSILLSRKLTKPLSDIIQGISALTTEQQVHLEEKGIFTDLAQNINHTSEMIRDKNNKIRLRNTAVSNWLTGISHDLRTPLSMILGYSALIEEDADSTQEMQSQARIIKENAVRIRNLITGLNLASSLQYEIMPLKLSQVKLSSIIRKAVADCINSGVLKKSNITLVIEDEYLTALIDESLLLRALVNLITNSVKHNKEDCKITVTIIATSIEGALYASIIVSDTGTGMSQDKIDRIHSYDYFNAWVSQTNGLGLVIVKSIIETFKGNLTIEAEEGKGTKITMRIPVDENNN